MSNISVLQSEINNLKCQTKQIELNENVINNLQSQIDYITNETASNKDALNCRAAALEWEVSDIRSALDAQTEKSKQKSDLEIFSQIKWDEEFLKIMNEPIIVDF